MNRKFVILAAVLGVIAAGAGYFAWSSGSELDRVRTELATTKTGADRARTELLAARNDLAKAQKDVIALTLTADQASAERDSVRKFLEAEQATGVKLRQDLAAAKEQISSLSARMAGSRPGTKPAR